jgi:hypothetical protein
MHENLHAHADMSLCGQMTKQGLCVIACFTFRAVLKPAAADDTAMIQAAPTTTNDVAAVDDIARTAGSARPVVTERGKPLINLELGLLELVRLSVFNMCFRLVCDRHPADLHMAKLNVPVS